MLDTSPRARARYYELLSQQTPARCLEQVARLSLATREFALAGIRDAEPGLSEVELKVRLAERLYGWQAADRIARRLTASSLPSR